MADARGEYWYLGEDVNPNKITMPELRSILLKHGVRYPASAKKPILLGLFSDHVLPQAENLQRTAARTKRSTRGIEDVPSSSATSTTDDAEDETLLPPQPTPRRAARRTTRATTEEEDRPVSRRAKTPSRTIPTKHARESDAEADQQPAMRRSRKSAVPAVKEPSPDPEAWHRPTADSPFTQDNPFQRGSSPLGPDPHVRDRRRKSMGFEHKEKRKSDANRRKTFQSKAEQLDNGIVVPTRRTFEVSVPRMGQEELASMSDGDLPSEEFTPEEQLSLVRERAKNGEVDILPPRRRRQPSKAASSLRAFLLTLLTTGLAVAGGVWRQEKAAIGFCGIGRDDMTTLAGIEIPDFASALVPQCEPCPPHAICYPNMQVTCEQDFIKKDHPLSFGGLVPLPPTCEPDTEKTRKINNVADRAVHLLRQQRAQYECGELDQDGNVVQSPEVSIAELKKDISSSKRKSVSNEEFEDLFAKAIGETKMREEVVQNKDGSKLASNSLAELPLVCSIRRSLRESVERHILSIVGFVLFVTAASFGKYSFTTNRAMEARAKQLASDVFDRLANQAALAHQEPGAYQDRGLSMNQLRDDVLRNEFSSSRRINLWKKVQKKVEHNSNIRAAVREGHGGDITRMWEWIGPIQLLEDSRGSGKRDGGRYSLGWTPGSSPPEPKEGKHWDEGHPIY